MIGFTGASAFGVQWAVTSKSFLNQVSQRSSLCCMPFADRRHTAMKTERLLALIIRTVAAFTSNGVVQTNARFGGCGRSRRRSNAPHRVAPFTSSCIMNKAWINSTKNSLATRSQRSSFYLALHADTECREAVDLPAIHNACMSK